MSVVSCHLPSSFFLFNFLFLFGGFFSLLNDRLTQLVRTGPSHPAIIILAFSQIISVEMVRVGAETFVMDPPEQSMRLRQGLVVPCLLPRW